jgi:hypothetical protein
MEGGPLAVRLTLRYCGDKPLDVFPDQVSPFSGSHIHPPEGWKKYAVLRFVDGNGGLSAPEASTQLQPGKGWTATYYLHHDYRSIPHGRTTLRLTWNVYKPGKWVKRGGEAQLESGDLLAHLSTNITIDIPKATPERLREMASQFEAKLRKRRGFEREPLNVGDCILHTAHEQFVPVALRLLRLGRQVPGYKLVALLYDSSPTPGEAHALMLDYLAGPHPDEAGDVFSFWLGVRNEAALKYLYERVSILPCNFLIQSLSSMLELYPLQRPWDKFLTHLRARQRRLTAAELRKVARIPNVWVRTLLYFCFPSACTPAWVEQLRRDLRQLSTPLPARELDALLRQLDAPRFAQREKATAELLRLANRVEPELRKARRRPLSPEAAERIDTVLYQLGKEDFDPLRQRTLARLEMNTPEARAVLAELAAGRPEARLTREAKAILAKLNKEKKSRR